MRKMLFFMLLLSSLTYNGYSQFGIKDDFIVNKIDSIGSYYLIYVSTTNETTLSGNYQIVSPKQQENNCKNIRVGEKYNMIIERIVDRYAKVGITYTPSLIIDEEMPDGSIIEYETEWGSDICFTEDLVGLCYKKG
ncbi:MAG: hypothetical protein LBO06_04535 [Bacteroidales bacterium]|nr:hypothetical protein [Bacteroidales bacterium]